ncbi:MAG: HAMP domain-containing histidine kinase [Schleiferilactobacillus harbinensis]|jgi:signal transduction histidine kinase|nr:HAMP domain-containing histidine kinase [Schleiferilactobacillus harbinensis]MCI1912809.1 HAMP domain-containing histidine kinase [Schleiferilactobacillus harbinensis]
MMILLWLVIVVLILIVVILLLDTRRIKRELTRINQTNTNAKVTATLAVHRPLVQEINTTLDTTRHLLRTRQQEDARVRQLMTNLVHDIKTPLAIAAGYNQLVQKNAPAPEDRARTQKVADSLATVSHYVDTLMNFSLLQETNSGLTLQPVNVTDLLSRLLLTYYDTFTAKKLTPDIELAPDLTIRTDERLLSRVFQNLIGNILTYGVGQPTIQGERLADQRVQFTFANAVAEPIPDVAALLARFATAHQTAQSSGLGLNIMQTLVQRLGGTVSLAASTRTQFVVQITFPGVSES